MNTTKSVFTALANLAASVNALAGVLDAATGRLRQQLDLDEAATALPRAGTILDAKTNGDGNSPSTNRRRGRAGVA